MAPWCGLAVFSYYLKNTPPDVALARGGYNIKESRDKMFNELGRAYNQPPADLIQMLLPDLVQWQDHLK